MLIGITALLLASGVARLSSMCPNLEFPEKGLQRVQSFHPLASDFPFDEAIVSWNVENPTSGALTVEARAIDESHHMTKWYVLADWSSDTKLRPRVSVDHQRDADGTVNTDTLHLVKPATQLEVRMTLRTLGDGAPARLKFVSVAFSNSQAAPTHEAARQSFAWGKTLEVPTRAQGNYPNGGVLCSPTSVSMILAYYANQLKRPELDHDVPEVEAGVWDTVYKGAGNWPFNTAYAGSLPGMRGYVARFTSISDLEKWTLAGFPVACSVSFDMLRGRPLSKTEQGHLVVLAGFTEAGDPVINDPAFTNGVRKTYPRADFERAWNYSHRTVYLIYPEDVKVPQNVNGLWAEEPVKSSSK